LFPPFAGGRRGVKCRGRGELFSRRNASSSSPPRDAVNSSGSSRAFFLSKRQEAGSSSACLFSRHRTAATRCPPRSFLRRRTLFFLLSLASLFPGSVRSGLAWRTSAPFERFKTSVFGFCPLSTKAVHESWPSSSFFFHKCVRAGSRRRERSPPLFSI